MTTVLAIVLLIASATLMEMPVQPVQAQLAGQQPYSGPLKAGDVPDFTVSAKAYLSVRPTLVGLGQIVLVNLWTTPAPHANRIFRDYKVTITKPDATREVVTMDSYPADGTAWFEWAVDKVGTWKFKVDFPGMYFPAGRYLEGDIITATAGGNLYTQSVYYKPSSTPEMTITVQEEMVDSWPGMPLPTDYWTRPVPYEYREWWPIAGNYPWRGPGGGPMWDELYPNTNPYWGGYLLTGMGGNRGHFTPWVQGPNSAHVVWKRQYTIAGIIGGDFGVEIYDVDIFGSSGVGRYPGIIYAGRGYDSYSKPGVGMTAQTYWRCYDLRTGELIWERPLEAGEAAPTVIEYFDRGLLPGGATTGVHEHVTAVRFLSISDGYLRRYHPYTGAMVNNISIAPLTGSGGTYYMNGHVLGVQDLGAAAGAQRYRLIDWTTFGTGTLAARIVSNITWPWSSLPDTTDYNVGISALVEKSFVGGAPNQTRVRAASLKTGAELWDISVAEWEYAAGCNYADHGKIAILTEQGYFIALDLYSGQLAWKSERFAYPWDDAGFGGYNVLSAYGLLYRNAYTGIYAFNWTNGKIAWKYTAPAAATYETPYVDETGQTVYSTNVGGAIADGKYYIYNTEHSATVPITRGWQLHCINATTGEGIWKVGLPGASSKHTTDIGPIADGYLTLASSDGDMYVFGKGKSATTVTAPTMAVQVGQSFTITGTVLDMSPAQPGTAAISDNDMGVWMEYLHKQMPKPMDAKGVTVTLAALDSNNNWIDIGEATSDVNGVFGLTWTPEVPGLYQIIATFAGSGSYGSSSASTYLSAVEAPVTEPTPEPTPTPASVADMYFVPAVIGIIIAIAIVGALLTLLMLRKRP